MTGVCAECESRSELCVYAIWCSSMKLDTDYIESQMTNWDEELNVHAHQVDDRDGQSAVLN